MIFYQARHGCQEYSLLPAQPAVMILGGLSVLLGLIWLPLGRLAALLAWPFAAYTIHTVELLARLLHSEIVLGSASLALVLLFGGTFAWPSLSWVPAFLKRSLLLAGLGAATVVVWDADRGVCGDGEGFFGLTDSYYAKQKSGCSHKNAPRFSYRMRSAFCLPP